MIQTLAAAALACGLGGSFLACGEPELYIAEPANVKSCRLDNFDGDCIQLAGMFCAESGFCRCANKDGTRPGANEPGDQDYCEGACRPVSECGWFTEDGGTEASMPEPECQTAADCPGPPDARCGAAICQEGVCGLELLAHPGELVATASQLVGDCQHVYCDATGSIVVVPDGADIYNDGNPCTFDMCEDYNPISIPFPDASPCPEGGSGYCYAGECVECMAWINGANDCGNGQACDFVYCVPMTCVANSDCGEGCAPCPAGFACDSNADCEDGVCGPNGMCALPSCTDGVANDGETGVDCGAPSCMAKCTDGDGCNFHSDCLSSVCWAGVCQAPTCEDGVKNADEIDIDCGGPCGPCQAMP